MAPSSPHYWQRLSRAISAAMQRSGRDDLRFLAIDDIVDISAHDENGARVTARAWLLGDDKDAQVLIEIVPSRGQSSAPDWDSLLDGLFTLEADKPAKWLRIRGILQTEGQNQ